MASHPSFKIILAPNRPPPTADASIKTVFLAGTTASRDWRTDDVAPALRHLPVAVYNPLRADWDSSWREDFHGDARYREQVLWETEMAEQADVVVVWFGAGSTAAVSLLELGVCLGRRGAGQGDGGRARGVVVGCEEGFWKKGNVDAICARYGVAVLGRVEDLAGAVVEELGMD